MMSANQEKLLRDTYTSLGKSVSLGGCSDDSLKMFYEFIKNNQKNTKIDKMIQDYEYLECCNVSLREIIKKVNLRYKEIDQREKQALEFSRLNNPTARFQQETGLFDQSSNLLEGWQNPMDHPRPHDHRAPIQTSSELDSESIDLDSPDDRYNVTEEYPKAREGWQNPMDYPRLHDHRAQIQPSRTNEGKPLTLLQTSQRASKPPAFTENKGDQAPKQVQKFKKSGGSV